MDTSFADRLWWARHHTGPRQNLTMGANIISRRVGCAQSLISNIERNNAAGTTYNDKIAKTLDVDPAWLRTGEGRVPKGFNPEEARVGRTRGGAFSQVIPFQRQAPAWAEHPPAESTDANEERARTLQSSMFTDFQEYALLVGAARVEGFLKALAQIASLMSLSEKPNRDD